MKRVFSLILSVTMMISLSTIIHAEEDINDVTETYVSGNTFLFSVNEYNQQLLDSINVVRGEVNYGWMSCSITEIDNEYAIMVFDKNFTTCAIIQLFNNDAVINNLDEPCVSELFVAIQSDDNLTIAAALFAIMMSCDPLLDTSTCQFILSEAAANEDAGNEPSFLYHNILFYVTKTDETWAMAITPQMSDYEQEGEKNKAEIETETEEAFKKATDIDLSDLTSSSTGSYSLDGIPISSEVVDKISIGTKLNPSAIYLSIAKQIRGFYSVFNTEELYPMWGEELIPRILGIEKKSTWEEMLPYIDSLSLIVAESEPIGEIISKLDQLDCSSGQFDYEKGSFHFSINDIPSAATELAISEEMLGFILAYITEYGAIVEFSGDSCSIDFQFKNRGELTERDFLYFHDYGEQSSMLDMGYGYWTFYIIDTTGEYFPNDSTWGFSTARGIQVLHSKNAVIMCYGNQESMPFSKKDLTYSLLKEQYGYEYYKTLEEATEYIVYTYDDVGQIVFFFNANEQVIGVTYYCGIAYSFDNIQIGDTGSNVVEIQEILIELGYLNGTADGAFGNMTMQAVRAFQFDNDLETTGEVDEETYKAMLSASS